MTYRFKAGDAVRVKFEIRPGHMLLGSSGGPADSKMPVLSIARSLDPLPP